MVESWLLLACLWAGMTLRLDDHEGPALIFSEAHNRVCWSGASREGLRMLPVTSPGLPVRSHKVNQLPLLGLGVQGPKLNTEAIFHQYRAWGRSAKGSRHLGLQLYLPVAG